MCILCGWNNKNQVFRGGNDVGDQKYASKKLDASSERMPVCMLAFYLFREGNQIDWKIECLFWVKIKFLCCWDSSVGEYLWADSCSSMFMPQGLAGPFLSTKQEKVFSRSWLLIPWFLSSFTFIYLSLHACENVHRLPTLISAVVGSVVHSHGCVGLCAYVCALQWPQQDIK